MESVVSQPEFRERCELVVSDNASTDGTEAMMRGFAARHPNVKYLRNEADIGADENFLRVTDAARGEYIHLLGDKVRYGKNALGAVLRYLEKGGYAALCLLNANKRWPRDLARECRSLDEFVDVVSFRSTWMSGIVLRRWDFNGLQEKRRCSGSCLIQTDWLLSVVARSGNALVLNKKTLDEQPVRKIGSYPLFEVFITNYRRIQLRFVESGELDRRTLDREMDRLLLGFVFQWYIMMVILRRQYRQAEGATSLVLRTYWRSPLLYFFPVYLAWWFMRSGYYGLRGMAGTALRSVGLIPRRKQAAA